MRRALIGALVPILAVAVILTRGGGGMQGEAKGGKAEPFVWSARFNWHGPDSQFEQFMDATVCCDPDMEPVETWVTNPLAGQGVAGDVDDAFVDGGRGDLTSGQVVSHSLQMWTTPNQIYKCLGYPPSPPFCGFWSGTGNPRYGISVLAPSASLVVTACYSPQDRCFTLSPVLQATKETTYRYADCLDAQYDVVSYDPLDYGVPHIEGSDGSIRGAFGVLTTITATVTNPTGAIVRGVVVETSADGDGRATVCPVSVLGPDYSLGAPIVRWLVP